MGVGAGAKKATHVHYLGGGDTVPVQLYYTILYYTTIDLYLDLYMYLSILLPHRLVLYIFGQVVPNKPPPSLIHS